MPATRTPSAERKLESPRVLPAGRRLRLRLRIPGVRTMDLYVARIFLAAYFACGFSFTGMYIMLEALTKLERFLKLDDPLWISLPRYHMAMIPTIFASYLGPILTTAAAVVTAVVLHRSNEINPLRACGVSSHRILAPIFVLAAAFAGLNYWLQEAAIPRLRVPIRQAISLTHEGALKPDPFFDSEGNQLIKIREYSPAVQVGRGVEVTKVYPNARYKEKIDASEIVWEPDPGTSGGPDRGRWILYNGSIQRWNEEGELIENREAEEFARLKEPFQKRELPGGLLPIDLETADQDIAYLSYSELNTQWARQQSQRHLLVKVHHHLAFPLAHLLLPAIAIPLVLLLGTRSVLVATGSAILVCAAFYLISSLAMSTAVHSDRFSPLLSAWLPVLLFGALGVTMTANMKT
jgi:lipopolysaccharide export system permease protein